MELIIKFAKKMIRFFKHVACKTISYLLIDIYFGKRMVSVPDGCIILFPCRENILCCGLSGIVSFKNKKKTSSRLDITSLNDMVEKIEERRFVFCKKNDLSFKAHYLGGQSVIDSLFQAVRVLKGEDYFVEIFINKDIQSKLSKLADRLHGIIKKEAKIFNDNIGYLKSDEADRISRRIEDLKDIAWCLTAEIADNIKKTADLLEHHSDEPLTSHPVTSHPVTSHLVKVFKNINAVLNSLDRLEVRGRDSAGISLIFILDDAEFEKFKEILDNADLLSQFKERSDRSLLVNKGISVHKSKDEAGKEIVTIAVTYKIAAEIGALGDNINFLRKQIKNDLILQVLTAFSHKYHTVSAHTRWASIGSINEPNCHPVDDKTTGSSAEKNGIIHVCLNGDIDNYLDLKREYESKGDLIDKDITTDTKIIPIQIKKYISQGCMVEEAFRLAVNNFKGSHAISMHTDLAPGKLFLAQKGSGQAIFIGLAEDHYMPTSEVYGFVEETSNYLKMDGEKIEEGKNGVTQGQIFVLDQKSHGGTAGIKAFFYDGTPIELGKKDIKHTDITSRDINRNDFPHYFLKEISESPVSVAKTLQNRWKIKEDKNKRYAIALDERIVPKSLQKALIDNLIDKRIRRIFFIGQGTAGVAALVCADILNYYMNDPSVHISALKASELSGFKLNDNDNADSMADVLVVAISQSGTTTDTNRTVDMVKERGAHTLAIVNRRDSDITFKTDGVMYTSSGRDIEMSVASTKAFYSQIIAGALLGLYIAGFKGSRNDEFVSEEIKQLLKLPVFMEKILSMRDKIEDSAKRLAVTRTYWAVVGSGPNKASADEIRIKLSELCYKTISSDYVEDKKHIDLSSEPLIIVCAAGTRSTVIGDIIKDSAIFQAHKAVQIVIADEGEKRFAPYVEDVFHVPVVSEHLAPVLNTLVGHIWGYYAALAINEGSSFLHIFHKKVQSKIDDYAKKGLDVYEVILEKSFREKIAQFYSKLRAKIAEERFPMSIAMASDLTLLLKYLSGRLPVSDFELDFGVKGTPVNMLSRLFECLEKSINFMVRPVDAIKHQAKTVTVGTSRISEKIEGILFETLTAHNFNVSQLINRNIIVLKNLQGIVSHIKGSILYRIRGLSIFGELTDKTTIEVKKKKGVLELIPSRVEENTALEGTKRIIVRKENVYIGKGRKDGHSIIVIPIISASRSTPNIIEYLLLLNISFKENIPISVKTKALGGKYEHIKNIVQENSVVWDDKYLELVETEELFGRSAEKIGEYIISSKV